MFEKVHAVGKTLTLLKFRATDTQQVSDRPYKAATAS